MIFDRCDGEVRRGLRNLSLGTRAFGVRICTAFGLFSKSGRGFFVLSTRIINIDSESPADALLLQARIRAGVGLRRVYVATCVCWLVSTSFPVAMLL